MQKTVTIPKRDYERLKRQAKINKELVKDLVEGLEDIKAGRVHRVL